MNPEFYDYIMDRLFAIGVLDVYLTPIQMKKNRPAIKLSVLVKDELVEKAVDLLLTETTTLGIRIFADVLRYIDNREVVHFKTKWGDIKIKLARYKNEVVNIAPEYDDCKEIARKYHLPLKEVYDIVKAEYMKEI